MEHGVIHAVQPNCLPLEDETVADKLKELGYATHAVGKWHLGFYKQACWPTRRGFDTFFGELAMTIAQCLVADFIVFEIEPV